MAAILGVTVSGLEKSIATNKAPPHFRAGRLIRWRPSVALAWLAEQTARSWSRSHEQHAPASRCRVVSKDQ
jgi:predicted DNA-binding transcriptional regulator AlpA